MSAGIITYHFNETTKPRGTVMVMVSIEMYQTAEKMPENGVPVIVSGGIAMRKTGGEWFTGMEEPLFQRPLEWEPKWWMKIPT